MYTDCSFYKDPFEVTFQPLYIASAFSGHIPFMQGNHSQLD